MPPSSPTDAVYPAPTGAPSPNDLIDPASPSPGQCDVTDVPLSSFKTRYAKLPDATFTLAQWLEFVRSGQAAAPIARIRAARGTPGYDSLKNKLRCVAYAGTYPHGRAGNTPDATSGLVFMELDHHGDGPPPPNWLEGEKWRLCSNPGVVACYTSCGGAGLHVIAAATPAPAGRAAYTQAWAWLTRELGLTDTGDPQVKDQVRLAAVSHDDDIRVNLSPTPIRWEPNTLENSGKASSSRLYKPCDLAEALRLTATHFGAEFDGTSDEDCKSGLRMRCVFHGGDNSTSLHLWLAEREVTDKQGGVKTVPFLAAKCHSRDCYGPSILRYVGREVGFVWPLPIPGGEAVVQQFLSAYPHRLAVVDRSRLYVRRESGLWVDGTRPSATVTAALQAMLKDMTNDGAWNQRQVDDLRSSLFYILERPSVYGVESVRTDGFDRLPLFPLREGGSIDARTLKTLDNDQTAGGYMMDQSSPGIDYRPALLNAGADHPGVRLAMHYEPDKANPRFQLIRRLGFLLLGPTKAVDSIIMPLSDSGKSTFARWLSFALPGYVSLVDAVVALSAQGTRFTAVQHRLSMFKLVILDECDKIEKPPSAGAFNALTADVVTVELKGKDAYEAPRRGNALMIGAAPPNLELGQGGRERLGWAFDGSSIGKMGPDLRRLIDDPEAQAWLATQLLTLAAEAHRTGDQAIDGDSRKAAAAVHAETANPLQAAISDCLERAHTNSVWADDIKERLKKYPDVPQPIPSRTFGSAMQMVFGPDMKSIPSTRQSVPARYYPGVRLI